MGSKCHKQHTRIIELETKRDSRDYCRRRINWLNSSSLINYYYFYGQIFVSGIGLLPIHANRKDLSGLGLRDSRGPSHICQTSVRYSRAKGFALVPHHELGKQSLSRRAGIISLTFKIICLLTF